MPNQRVAGMALLAAWRLAFSLLVWIFTIAMVIMIFRCIKALAIAIKDTGMALLTDNQNSENSCDSNCSSNRGNRRHAHPRQQGAAGQQRSPADHQQQHGGQAVGSPFFVGPRPFAATGGDILDPDRHPHANYHAFLSTSGGPQQPPPYNSLEITSTSAAGGGGGTPAGMTVALPNITTTVPGECPPAPAGQEDEEEENPPPSYESLYPTTKQEEGGEVAADIVAADSREEAESAAAAQAQERQQNIPPV